MLDKKKIKKEIIESCLSVLARGKAEKIENLLDDDYVAPTTEEHLKNKKLQFKLMELGEKYYNYDDITKYCTAKKVSFEQFIQRIVLNTASNEKNTDTYKKIFEENKNKTIYVGKNKSIQELNPDYLKRHGTELIDIAREVASKFVGRYGRGKGTFDDIAEEALQIIITKGGNIVYNLEEESEVVKRSLESLCQKSLLGLEVRREISITYEGDRGDKQFDIKDDSADFIEKVENDLDASKKVDRLLDKKLEKNNFIEVEMSIIHKLYEGMDLDEIAEKMDLSDEEIQDDLSNIREKMLESKIVQKTEKGYEFGD
ncbi:MAG: helix-turn-helix domain-containing protein [Lachnospiraceae bacterium]|nr:helix-turn-helix domain-containing protein [Lachnospiraceae bacterium]